MDWVQPWVAGGCGQTTSAMVVRRMAGRRRRSGYPAAAGPDLTFLVVPSRPIYRDTLL